jgi:hypothetical protein
MSDDVKEIVDFGSSKRVENAAAFKGKSIRQIALKFLKGIRRIRKHRATLVLVPVLVLVSGAVKGMQAFVPVVTYIREKWTYVEDYERIESLYIGANRAYIEKLYGTPTFFDAGALKIEGTENLPPSTTFGFTDYPGLDKQYSRAVFVRKTHFLTTLNSWGGKVEFISVVSRKKDFHPIIPRFANSKGRLGRANYAHLSQMFDPKQIYSHISASAFTYFEKHHIGEKDECCFYFIGSTFPAGAKYESSSLIEKRTDISNSAADLKSFRESSTPNAFAISIINDERVEAEVIKHFGIGPNRNEVSAMMQ